MVKDKLSLKSSSVKTRSCFFCLAAFVFLVFSLTSPAFARQSLEYNTVTALWEYSARKDTAPPVASQQALEYNIDTGLWNYSTRDTVPTFPTSQVIGRNPIAGLWY